MGGKKLRWATVYLVGCWALLPTILSCGWGFQDYFQDWASARNWWEGTRVYSPHAETVPRYLGVDFEHLGDGKLYEVLATVKINAHPPSSVLFYLPFALLPYWLSFLAWNLVSTLCLVVVAVILIRELELKFEPWLVVLVGTVGICGGPMFEQMFFGQSNALTVTFLVVAWHAQRKGYQVWEGCCLGTAAALKLYPLLLLVIPLGARRWRSLAAAVGTGLLFLVLSLGLFGWTAWNDYRTLGAPEAVVWSDLWVNASVYGFWKKLLISQNRGTRLSNWHSLAAFWICYLLSWGGVALTTLALSVWRKAASNSDRTYAIATCAMLLLSPTCWPHYFLMLFLPVGLLWRDFRDAPRARRLLIVCVTLLILPPGWYGWCTGEVFPVGSGGTARTLLSFLSAQTYALVGVWVLAVFRELGEIGLRHTLPSPNNEGLGRNPLAA
jgi:hypothetical protein